jgi:hypothetical protein
MAENMEIITIIDPNIKSYTLAHNDNVISVRINNCNRLTMIDVELCNNLTTITIENCPLLNDITITNCQAFTTLSPLPPGLTEFNCDETIIDKLCENPDFLFSFIYLTGQPDFTTNIDYTQQLKLVNKLEMFNDTNNALFEAFMHEVSNPLLSRLPDTIKAEILSYLNDRSADHNASRISLLNMAVNLVKTDSKAKIKMKKISKLGGKRKTKKRSKKRSKRKSKRSRKGQKKRHHSRKF